MKADIKQHKLTADIKQWEDRGEKQLTVCCMENGQRIYIASLDYRDINQIDITPAWKELEKHKYSEFFMDFVMKLSKYSNGFIISKYAMSIREFLEIHKKNLGIEEYVLPTRKVRSDVEIRTNLDGATTQDFDPNKYVWAYRFI